MGPDSWHGRLDLRGSVGRQDGATVGEEVCRLTWPLTDDPANKTFDGPPTFLATIPVTPKD